MQLLVTLTPEPQTIAHLCKRLRMKPAQLALVLAANRDALVDRGMHLHVATASEVGKAIKLPSISNPAQPAYYSRISKNLFSVVDQEQRL